MKIMVFYKQVLMDLFAAQRPMDPVIIQFFLTVSTHTTLNQKSNANFQDKTTPETTNRISEFCWSGKIFQILFHYKNYVKDVQDIRRKLYILWEKELIEARLAETVLSLLECTVSGFYPT